MPSKSLYEILQVRADASLEVIKAAYKTLSVKYHPDRNSSAEASRKFAEIQHAYDLLSDPIRRGRYDLNPEAVNPKEADSVAVLRTNGTSTFLTLQEHLNRGWQESEGCDLSNQEFSGLSFKDARLVGAKLDGSRFVGCDFRGADLTNCSAKQCQFDNVDFAGAKLINSDLSQSSIRGAKFFSLGSRWESECPDPKARFSSEDPGKRRSPDCQGGQVATILRNVDLSHCNLSDAQFSAPSNLVSPGKPITSGRNTPLWSIQYFNIAVINSCNFFAATLVKCGFKGMDLKGSTFGSANLQQADMRNCDIGAVDLSSANLLDTNLTKCTFSDGTKFPSGFPTPNGSTNPDEAQRQEKGLTGMTGNEVLLLLVIGLIFFAGLILLNTLFSLPKPTPPLFHVRPNSGVQVNGVFSAWQIPEGDLFYNPNQRMVILEISSLIGRNTSLPQDDLTLEIFPDAVVSKMKFLVIGNRAPDMGVFSFPPYVFKAQLPPVSVHNGRSQLRFFWTTNTTEDAKEPNRVGVVSFHVTSKSLNSKGVFHFSQN